MGVDIDEFLSQAETNLAQKYSHDTNDFRQHAFGLDGFDLYDSYDNNAGLNLDPFSNDDGLGGHGSLQYFGSHDGPSGLDGHSFSHSSEHIHGHQESALAGFDDHSSFQDSQHSHEQHQVAIPSSHISHPSHQGAEQFHDPSAMLIDGQVEDVAESIEQGQDSREEEGEEDAVPLKHEEHDSDDEFKEDDGEDEAAEEDQDDEEDEGGQKKKRKKEKRKPYKQPRILTRWDTSTDQLALLTLIHILDREKVPIPYKELNLHINGGANWDDKEGGPVGQHLSKVRKARIYFGMPVPPPKKSARNSNMDTPKVPSEKEIKTYHSLTYTRPGREDKMDGVPGTMEARYTPIPIPDRPDLPIHEVTLDPPMGPLPENFRYSDYRKLLEDSVKASNTAPASDKKQSKPVKSSVRKDENEEQDTPVAVSTEKKRRPAKKIVKAEEDDDVQYSAKPARKGQSTSVASKRKTAAERASESTPSKPKGVVKSQKTPATLKKTPATVTKKIAAMAVDSADGKLDLTATPSKKTTRGKAKPKANVASEAEQMFTTEESPVATTEAEPPSQSYGRVNMTAVSMPAQSFGNMHAGLPSNKFQMGKHQANHSFDSQSSVSTVPSQSMLDTPVQFLTNGFTHGQNNYSGNGYGHQMMPAHGPSFAHGHGMQGIQNMDKQELIQRYLRLEQQQAAARPMQQFNNSYNHANFQAHGYGPHGLGIANAPAMMPQAQFDTEMGNYTFASGPASNLPSQQQIFSNEFAQMQNDGNDIKPNMEQFSGGFSDLPDFDLDTHQ